MGVDFLDFLRSGEKDIHAFANTYPMLHHNRATVINLIFSLVVFAVQISVSSAEQPAQKSSRTSLYDTSADGKKQIAAALKTAKAEDKCVLLKFGANW